MKHYRKEDASPIKKKNLIVNLSYRRKLYEEYKTIDMATLCLTIFRLAK